MTLAAGARLGPYEIVALLGAGGMGEVFRARDTRLEREVALKVLPESFADDADGRARFEREARTLAALHHPHIVTVYDVGEEAGRAYLAMELLEGTSLREALGRGRLQPQRAVEIAVQLTRGLAAAHDQGILHRDLKPQNLFLTEHGVAKILDFGLAKAIAYRSAGPGGQPETTDQPTATALTAAGVIVGTPGYMSPEQIRGEPADARSDLFSFGCVLFEMLSGAPAFTGASSMDVCSAVLRDDPPDLSAAVPAVPPALAAVVKRCLEKRPRDRFQTARDLAFALDQASAASGSTKAPAAAVPSGRARGAAWAVAGAAILVSTIAVGWFMRPAGPGGVTGPVVPPHGMSVAVLAFVNMSGNPENEYLGDGLAEEIINVIARSGVRVVARTSAFSFKGKNTDVREIGRQLGVGAIVEGAVRQSGERLRVTAQLIRADDGSYLWSETFDRPTGDLFAIQDEIAGAVLRSVTPSGATPSLPTSREARDPQAHESYLRGRYEGRTWSSAGLERAERLFDQAVARDPAFGDAWAALADTVILRRELHQVRSRDEAYAKALAAARQSLASSPPSADGHAALAHMLWHEGRWSAAEDEARRALALNASSATARQWLGLTLATVGRLAEAEAEYREALALDPLTAAYHGNLGAVLRALGRFEEALASLDRDVELAGTYRRALVLQRTVDCLVDLRRVDEADRRLQTLDDSAPGIGGLKEAFRARTLAARGREREAREALRSFTSTTAIGDEGALVVAWAYASAGDAQATADWMGRASLDRRTEWLALYYYSPELQRISDHPRLQAFLAEAGLRGLPATRSGTPGPPKRP